MESGSADDFPLALSGNLEDDEWTPDAGEAWSEDSIESELVDDQLSGLKHDRTTAHDEKGPIEAKVEERIQLARIKKHVQPPAQPQDVNELPFQFVYDDLPVVEGRNFVPQILEARRGSVWDLRAVMGLTVCHVIRLSKEDYTYDEVKSISSHLTDAVNRWPSLDDIATFRPSRFPTASAKTLLRSILAQYFPEKPSLINMPSIVGNKKTQKACAVHGVFNFIEKITVDGVTTLRSGKHTQSLFPGVLNLHMPVPPSEHVAWGREVMSFTIPLRLQSKEEWAADRHPMVKPNERDNFVYAEKCFRYVISKLSRCFSPAKTMEEVRMAVKDTMNLIQGIEPGSRNINVYDGGAIFYISRDRPVICTRIITSKAFCRNVEMPPVDIRILSGDKAWARVPCDAGMERWMATGDILDAIRTTAKVADAVNRAIRAGKSSPSDCDCDPEVTDTILHPCGRCGSDVPCQDMRFHVEGYRSCKPCLQLTTFCCGRRAALVRARIIMNNSVAKDARLAKRDITWQQNLRAASFEELEGLLQGQEGNFFINKFNGKMTPGALSSYHPLNLSFDAVLPFVPLESGGYAVHAPGNLAPVSAAENCWKHVQIPICLKKIGDYYSRYRELEESFLRGEPAARAEVRHRQAILVKDCHRFAYIRRKVPRDKHARINISISFRRFQFLLEEWLTGRLHNDSEPPVQPLRVSRNNMASDYPLVLCIIDEIEVWTEVRLPRANGCPWFLEETEMPDDWNWNKATALVYKRLKTMTRWCNKKWVTVETVITIFLECVLQVSLRLMVVRDDEPESERKRELQRKYAEFLGLPLSYGTVNHLAFVVAHRVHGYAMFTGWPVKPTSFRERLDNDEKNNILIETRSSNYLKMDFAEAYYPMLQQIVLDLDMPSDLADESGDMGEFVEELDITPTNGVEEYEEDTLDKQRMLEDKMEELESVGGDEDSQDDG